MTSDGGGGDGGIKSKLLLIKPRDVKNISPQPRVSYERVHKLMTNVLQTLLLKKPVFNSAATYLPTN